MSNDFTSLADMLAEMGSLPKASISDTCLPTQASIQASIPAEASIQASIQASIPTEASILDTCLRPEASISKHKQVRASKGGHARARALTPERRREIAQHAIKARWAKRRGKVSIGFHNLQHD